MLVIISLKQKRALSLAFLNGYTVVTLNSITMLMIAYNWCKT